MKKVQIRNMLLTNAALIFCLLSLIIYKFKKSEDVVVQTKLGRVKGLSMKTALGKTILAFRGIYYAKPPTGQLRFKVQFPDKQKLLVTFKIIGVKKY